MGAQPQVVVSYPVDDEFAGITLDALAGEASVVFGHHLGEAGREQAVRSADALIGWRLGKELPAGALHRSPRLRLVQLIPAGADGVDFATIPDGVVVASNAGAYAEPIAEHVLAMTLALAKRLPQRHAELAGGDFDQREPSLTLDGALCVIAGFGGIGRATARLMRPFGARIHAVTRSGTADGLADTAGDLAGLDEVLPRADVLVVALPLTVATRGLLGAGRLALMKRTAIVVNVARADIIDQAALYGHLRAHPEFSAGLDVWWDEPEPGAPFHSRFPFFGLPNVIGSPHNSGMVRGVLQSAARAAATNVRRYLRGEPVTGVIRREDYPGPS